MRVIAEIISLISSFILSTIQALGYGGVFGLMLLESAGIPIPSEIIMPFSGFLVTRGAFDFWAVVAMGTLGNVAGSLLFYWLGRLYRSQKLEKWPFFLSSDQLERAERWFGRWGNWAVFFSRMLPGVRTYISFPAGVARMRHAPFTILTLAGSLPWVFVLALIGVQLGQRWEAARTYFEKFDVVILVLLVAGVGWWLWRKSPKSKVQNAK